MKPRILDLNRNENLDAFYKKLKGFVLLIVLAFFSLNSAYAQNAKIDSLRAKIDLFQEQPNIKWKDTNYIKTLDHLATELFYYNSDSTHILAKEVLSFSTQLNYVKGKMSALNNLGAYYASKGKNKIANSYFEQIMKLAKKSNNNEYLITAYFSLGNGYYFNKKYDLALQEYLDAIKIAKKNKKNEWLAKLYTTVSDIYYEVELYNESVLFSKKAIVLFKELNNEITLAHNYINLAISCTKAKKLDNALSAVNKGISILEKYDDWRLLAYGYNVKGEVYLKRKKYKNALYWLNKSSSIHQNKIDRKSQLSSLYNNLAETHLAIGNHSLSENFALKGLSIAQKINEISSILSNSKTLYEVYKRTKAHDKALSHFELFKKTKDTLTQIQNIESILMQKTRLNYKKQQEQLAKENEKVLSEHKKNIYASLLLAFILIGTTIFANRKERLHKELNKQVYEKKKKLRESEAQLLEISQSKNKLFSIVGHDLKEPIGAIQSIFLLLKVGQISKKKYLDLIPKLSNDVDRMSFTLNNLLIWGKTQKNGFIANPSIVSLNEIIDQNIYLITERAKLKAIKITHTVPNKTMAWTDKEQINIVFRNLLSNALKFTPFKGEIAIRVSSLEKFWKISVSDTGIGMDLETQKNIFSGYLNIATYGTRNEKGTGIGLLICKEMINYNKGKIWVESGINKGTIFCFTIPKAVQQTEENRLSNKEIILT